jgi:tyrosinase
VTIAAGTGGGCVLDGPFAHSNDNIGPAGPPQVTTAFNYNPRCITRDWRPDFMASTLQYNNITNLLNQTDLTSFQNLMVVSTGVHAGGHRGLGGLQDDLYASNGDPAFYFHHASIDHMWTIWQGLDLKGRLNQVTGTLTCKNSEFGILILCSEIGS